MVGFDDLPAAAWPLVRLTTVAFDLDAMARKAANLLVRRIEAEEPLPYEHAVFSPRWSAAGPWPRHRKPAQLRPEGLAGVQCIRIHC